MVVVGALASAGCGERKHITEKDFLPIPGQPDESTLWSDRQIVHNDRLAEGSAHRGFFWAWLLPMGGSLAFAAFWERVHRERRKAEQELVADRTRKDGPAVIKGEVETDGGDAITVEILQERTTFKDKQGNEHHSWKERSRRVIARPFRVVLPGGESVRVEPDSRVLLRDKVEQPQQVDETHRKRNVRLRPREKVWVAGQLSGSGGGGGGAVYRQAEPTAVMKPGRFTRMIVSTEAPGAYFKERAEHHRAWQKGLWITMLIAQVVVFGGYTLQALSGRPERLPIERYRSWSVWVKPKNSPGRWVEHYAVDARRKDEKKAEEFEVSGAFHRCVEQRECQTLPVTSAWLTGGVLRQVGRGPSLHIMQAIFPGLVGWVVFIVYAIATRVSRPWYAGGKINDAVLGLRRAPK